MSGFEKGAGGGGVQAGVYTCKDCKKRTRETGSCESNVGLCLACYDAAGLENEHTDGHHEDRAHPDCLDCETENPPDGPDGPPDDSCQYCGGDRVLFPATDPEGPRIVCVPCERQRKRQNRLREHALQFETETGAWAYIEAEGIAGTPVECGILLVWNILLPGGLLAC